MKKWYSGLIIVLLSLQAIGQETDKPTINCIAAHQPVRVDGWLNEKEWSRADSITSLYMVEPELNGTPSFQTIVKILVTPKNIYLGVKCFDDQPEGIVAFSKARDSELEDEDYIKLILDTYRDGRNGYIFAINPFAARYDALVSFNGESENPNWDGAWDAQTQINDDFWSAEIRIPLSTLTYNKSLDSWGFNIERRIQRFMEVNRWSGISMDYTIGQTRHAGLITELPEFNPGIGLTPRVSVVAKATQDGENMATYNWSPSLDVTQRITTDITAQLTMNTDFAETEVDSRQTNLTRFPILYPEKRQFFLEGADIFDFGISLGRSLMPFYSRRIGLYEGKEVPILWGGKVNGKVKDTHFGSLITQTGAVDSLVPGTKMGVVRIKQNILKESSFGMIATMGDPGARNQAWTAGVDFTYQTSTFGSNRNFLVGGWGMINNRDGLEGDKTAVGIKIDYPNDLWDWFVHYRRIGDAFDPSMGFVNRRGINYYSGKVDFMPRPENRLIRQHRFQFSPSLYTDLDHHWESYRVFFAPVNAMLESGDRLEFNIMPQGEYLKNPFEISNGVTIDPGGYHWMRYRMEASTASKRAVNGMATYWFGGFYGGKLDQIELLLNWRVMSFLVLEFIYENNIGRIPAGNFNKELMSVRTAVNISSNLNVSLFVQYDNESNSVGSYSRLRWTFAPLGDLFIVYKHNIQPELTDRWQQDQNQLIVKLTYGLAL
ncbi:MAG: DUF5916 domain-containing protein [Bacteroidota bacterium]